MADQVNCNGCAYSQEQAIDPHNVSAERLLVCRRRPPVPVFIPTPRGVSLQTVHPLVARDGWCGDYLDHRTVVRATGQEGQA